MHVLDGRGLDLLKEEKGEHQQGERSGGGVKHQWTSVVWTVHSLPHSSFFSAPYLQTDMQHFEECPGTTERELKPDDCCQPRVSIGRCDVPAAVTSSLWCTGPCISQHKDPASPKVCEMC